MIETDYNENFMKHVVPSLHWPSVLVAAEAVGFEGLPATLENSMLDDADFLQALHHLLLDIHIVQGTLECPESGRTFPITDAIPNMMYNMFYDL